MEKSKSGSEVFRPYARLISVLGDQLISDKWIGVIELVKNCYDADADYVAVRFLNFENPSKQNIPTIEIEDDGEGMTLDIIRNVWMKPATPNKLNQKKGAKRFTKKKRVMQGDKGVGRFAIYKLGSQIEVFTKTSNTAEIKLMLDFTDYAHDEFEKSDHQDKFLDEMQNEWQTNPVPAEIKNSKGQGTLIRIKNHRNNWKKDDLDKLAKAFFRMIPPTMPGQTKITQDFNVKLFWDAAEYKSDFLSFEQIADMAPFYFEGSIDKNGEAEFTYKHNRKKLSLKFNIFSSKKQIINYDLRSLKLFREQFIEFGDDKKTIKRTRIPTVGGFMFFFYAFDWRNPIEGLKDEEKKFLQENSVYLYRDNVRVFPYGERGVDWLMLSKLRAEDRAGSYFSYNDLIGFIFITQHENPKLRDAADREGLMNIDGAYDDFIATIQACLKVMKDEVEIDKKKEALDKDKTVRSFNKAFEDSYTNLQKTVQEYDDKNLLEKTAKFFKATNTLVEKVREDLKITQELAGTGMAVEKATHDTLTLLKRLRMNASDMADRFDKNEISKKELRAFLQELEDSLEFLYQELQVIQPLLRVSRKITKDVSVKDVAERVRKYFRKELDNKIKVTTVIKGDVVVKTNTGLILQVLINLMDNSIYWVNHTRSKEREIMIKIDGSNDQVIFADNGHGIEEDISEIVFVEFYSKKAEGRGLGLYIVKELLERIGAEISIIHEEKLKVLDGANFLIEFKKEN